MKTKELLFSITKDDFEFQTFRAGGKGGQHQNKTNSGVRLIHKKSGAVGESRSERSQAQNKKLAFKRLVESHKFKRWLSIQINIRAEKEASIERLVDESMKPENLKIEGRINGAWTVIDMNCLT